MAEDSIQFQNMDSWKGGGSGKFGLTFKQIVLMHINRTVINGSVEMCGGYWQYKQREHWTEKFYVPDSREVYNNSVRMLRALLIGYFDKQMKEADELIQQEFKDLYEECKGSEDKTKIKEYYEERVNIHIRLFEELIKLSKRLNFFEEESSEEEL